jgi:xylitol oxidase
MKRTNWAGNYEFSAPRYSEPESVDQVQHLVHRSAQVKVLGAGHSFNAIADTSGDQISLRKMARVLSLDKNAARVTVEGGIKYGPLCQALEAERFALPNLASLPHITVAGACATATHGSGSGNGNLATPVAALELVTGSGDVVELSRGQAEFDGAVVGLGALGVVTKLTLDIVPSFTVRQQLFENLPLAVALEHLDEIQGHAYSVSLFTDWKAQRFNQVWVKRKVSPAKPGNPESTLWGAVPATQALHPIPGVSAVHCTEQLSVPGPWHERLPHFRMDFVPSNGEELQTEYLVPRANGREALQAVSQLSASIAPVLQIAEVRSVAADSLWLSPCRRRDCVAFHFTWKKDWPAVRPVLAALEERLVPLGALPHWGKLFAMSTERLRSLFEKWPDFQQLRKRFDPQGKFSNTFLDS